MAVDTWHARTTYRRDAAVPATVWLALRSQHQVHKRRQAAPAEPPPCCARNQAPRSALVLTAKLEAWGRLAQVQPRALLAR
jgi:hypothetical protein